MVGITSYGAYVPYYRLSRAEIARSWGGGSSAGERAVASYDEDSLTMAVAAARDCMTGMDPRSIDGLYFASTTSPYREKQAAAVLAAALDLKKETLTGDFANSLRGGTIAMRAAADAVSGGSAQNILVCAADRRLGYPAGDKELSIGDGAAAIEIGKENVIAAIEGAYTLHDEITDVWRSDRDTFVRSWEDRFTVEEGYERLVTEAVAAATKQYQLSLKDFAKVALYAPNLRQLRGVAGKLRMDVKAQVPGTVLHDLVGDTGTASAMMSLVMALEEAKPGERILLVSYGNGCDVLILKVTDQIEKARNHRGIKKHLAAKQVLATYQKYLRWRELLELQPMARPDPIKPSAPALWRDTKGGLALYGVKCRKCGTAQYPAQRVCVTCQAKDSFEDYRFADKVGTVFTFSQDNLAFHPDPPATVTAIDFPDGGRIMCDMTDVDPREVKVGMSVEMTFRMLRYVGGIYNYWWKCRPVRF